jgi:hypothetical protein
VSPHLFSDRIGFLRNISPPLKRNELHSWRRDDFVVSSQNPCLWTKCFVVPHILNRKGIFSQR